MFEFIASWIGVIATIALIGKVITVCLKLHYANEKEKRLERFDLSLLPESSSAVVGLSHEAIVLKSIIDAVNTHPVTGMVGREVVNLLEKEKLITSARADFVKR